MSTSSYSSSQNSTTDSIRYHGYIQAPTQGYANQPLPTIRLILERLDANGQPLRTLDQHTSGLVAQLMLATPEDGSADLEFTSDGTRYLVGGSNAQSPQVIDDRLVVDFPHLVITQAGEYRIRVRVFDLHQTMGNLPSCMNGPVSVPAEAIFNEVSEVVFIQQ